MDPETAAPIDLKTADEEDPGLLGPGGLGIANPAQGLP